MTDAKIYPLPFAKRAFSRGLILLLCFSLLLLAASSFVYWNALQLLKLEQDIKIEGLINAIIPFGQMKLSITNSSLLPFTIEPFSIDVYGSDGFKLMLLQNPQSQRIQPRSTAKIPIVPIHIKGALLNITNLKEIKVKGKVKITILGIKVSREIERKICNVTSVTNL